MIFLAMVLIVMSALLLTFMSIVCFRRRRLSAVVFFATAGYAFMAVINSEYLINKFGEDVYTQMSLIYVIGSFVLSISVQYFSEFVPKYGLSLPVWNQSDFHWHATFAFVLALASIALIVFARGEALLMNWSEARASSGFFVSLATSFFMLASPGIVSAFHAKRPTLGVMLLLLSVGLFVVIGSRASLLVAIFLGAWLMLLKEPGRRSRSLSRFWVITIALVVVLLVHTILRTLRGFGIAGLLQAFNEGNLLAALFLFIMDDDVSLTGGESDMPIYLMFAITQSSIDDFGFMTSIQRLLLLPMPSIQGWTAKPIDVTGRLWNRAFEQGFLDDEQGQAALLEAYVTGNYGSLHPTFFGEYFLAGGWMGLVMSMFLLGAVFVAIDLFMHRADRFTSLALCGPILVGYLFVARGSSVAGLGFFVYLGAVVGLLRYAARRVKGLWVAAIIANSATPRPALVNN